MLQLIRCFLLCLLIIFVPKVSDALALAARFGCPTFFVTVTCNPEWPEITSCFRPGQKFHDRPIDVARVFRQKLTDIMAALSKMFPNAGRVLSAFRIFTH